MKHAPDRTRPSRLLILASAAGLALSLAACAAATRPPDASAPRANEAPYPVLLEADGARRDRALANWGALVVGAPEPAAAPPPELRPVTATVASIPQLSSTLLRLPRVVIESEPGSPARQPTEEELRESLRRFVASAAPLLGVEQREISLVEIAEAPGGSRRALYRQKPFAHPLRNGYGEISITFAPDLTVTAMSSTAIPAAEQLRRALAAVTPQLSDRDAVTSLAGKSVTVGDTGGGPAATRTITTTEGIAARELVVYPRAAGDSPERVELRLAWEVDAGAGGPPLLVYVDAVTGEVLAARPA
jgi:hypothetical protein